MTDYLKEFYENYDEDGRLRSKSGIVEFLTTMRYIDKYIFEGARIMEIGAGTGRYSHEFAQRGYRVDAVELLEHNIEIFKRNTQINESITITQGNALDLSRFNDNTYDITLLLGPMYHLYTEEEQSQALAEAIRVTKRGGVVFVAYCGNDATILEFGFLKSKILQPPYNELIDFTTFKAFSTPEELFQLYRREDIDRLVHRFDVTRLNYVGSDMATHYMRNCIEEMPEEVYRMYLEYHFTICERQDMVGISHHILDILRKN
ncbi:MAG: class I SAM-dependent methyltransferase [Clostridiales bacterium]|nr:class I SAM-dependent methyltransferase [Clostridiales bacterium]